MGLWHLDPNSGLGISGIKHVAEEPPSPEGGGIAASEAESLELVAFTSVENDGGLLLRGCLSVRRQELVDIAGLDEKLIPQPLVMTERIISGISTAGYRSLLGEDCADTDRITRLKHLPDYRVLVESPWSEQRPAAMGTLCLWAPESIADVVADWIAKRVEDHEAMEA